MKLYFKNSKGDRRLIAKPQTEDDAYKVIEEFCENRHFKIYYIRTWRTPDGLKYDIGSHNEFFYLDDNE